MKITIAKEKPTSILGGLKFGVLFGLKTVTSSQEENVYMITDAESHINKTGTSCVNMRTGCIHTMDKVKKVYVLDAELIIKGIQNV